MIFRHTTVLNFYRKAVREGLWEKILKMLVGKTREANGKNDNPTYALIDSQNVKTVYNSEKRGFDGRKNERTKTAHSYRYYRKSPRCSCSHSNIYDTKGGVSLLKKHFFITRL